MDNLVRVDIAGSMERGGLIEREKDVTVWRKMMRRFERISGRPGVRG